MGAVAFDTLEFVETLRDAGVPKEQAKAFSIVVQKSYEDADLATKQDITELRNELRYEMHDLRKDMKVKHDALRTEMHHLYEALRADVKHQISTLRHEMHDFRKDMDAKHTALRVDMQHQNKALELHLTIKLGAIVVAATGVLPLLSKLLHLF